MIFQPRLDGLRGWFILLVFLTHLGLLDCGWIGVQAFFVLSGYLITGVLLEDLRSDRYFANFYVRRTLRIFPIYFVYLGLPVLLAWLAAPAYFEAVVSDHMVPTRGVEPPTY